MAKKDTTDTIRAMLGEQGQAYRPSGDTPAFEVQTNGTEEPPATSSATARRARKPNQQQESDPQVNAPRTLRLSQPMANALRDAWLEAKREDVLLTYQDFADRVVRTGLHHPSG